MTQRELKQRIMDDPDLTRDEKAKLLNALRVPYVKMSDEELLQLVRDFTREHGREPAQADDVFLSGPFREKADQPGPQAWLICNIKKFSADIFGLRLPAAASCLGRHSHLAGRGPNSSSLFLPLAAVVAVAERTRRPF